MHRAPGSAFGSQVSRAGDFHGGKGLWPEREQASAHMDGLERTHGTDGR